MDRQAYHVGLATSQASTSTPTIAARCLTANLPTSVARFRRAPRGNTFRIQCASDTSEDVAATNSMQWLWDRKASMTKDRVKSRDVQARKSLGQNYLINEAVLETIISKTGVQAGDCVLEVGPGTGNLTKHLLLKGARVLAIEKDTQLAEKLFTEFSSKTIEPGMLRIVTADVLRVNLRNAIACCAGLDVHGPQRDQTGDQHSSSTQPAVDTTASVDILEVSQEAGAVSMPAHRPRIIIVANLPFYITKDFLQMLLPMGDIVSHVYLLLQEEVATRLIEGGPGDRDYRAANLELLFYSQPKYLFTIGRTSFFPPPKCNGAFVELQLHLPNQRPVVDDDRAFVKFVAAAFSQRRKMLYNSLAPLYTTAEVAAALKGMGLSENARAQDLNLGQYVQLYNTIAAHGKEGTAEEGTAEESVA